MSLDNDAKLHAARALRMYKHGAEVEAGFYMYVMLQGAQRYVDYLKNESDTARTANGRHRLEQAEEEVRVLEGACSMIDVNPADDNSIDWQAFETTGALTESSVFEETRNPHWPKLSACVYVGLHHREKSGSLAEAWFLEVQIHPPDTERTQFNYTKTFTDEVLARKMAGVWARVGRAIVAEQVRMNEERGTKR